MNQRLQAMLDMLDKHTKELKASNDRYRATNDHFAAWLRERGVPHLTRPL